MPARAMRRVQLRGGARRQPARRTCCTLSRLSRAPYLRRWALIIALRACRRNPARAMRRVQLRGGARRQPARRTCCTLSRRSRAPTKQMGPYHLGACRRNAAGARRRVQLRGGARRPGARRSPPTLSARTRAPTKQMGPYRTRSSGAGRREGSSCEAAPEGRARGVVPLR